MNVLNALKVTCVGMAGGVLLRTVQMLFFYDYETGFYTDGGVMAWISFGVVAAACVLACVMCFKSRRYFGAYVQRKNPAAGAAAGISGLLLLASAVMQGFGGFGNGVSATTMASAEWNVIYKAFLVCSGLFGLVQLVAAAGFFTGKNLLKKVPLLYLVGTLWGIAYLVLVYVFYARSTSFVENFFAVFSVVTTLPALFYLCKLFAGVDEAGAAKRVYVCGICSVIITVTYSFSNLALLLLGKSYTGEIPPMIELANLGVAAFLLIFLITFRMYSIKRPGGNTAAAEGAAGVQENGPQRQ